MIEAAYVIITLGFIYLGVRLFMKIREIASWKSDDDLEGTSIPHDLRELKIEEPKSDPGSLDGIDEGESKDH